MTFVIFDTYTEVIYHSGSSYLKWYIIYSILFLDKILQESYILID